MRPDNSFSSTEQTMKTPNCKYIKETTKTFQITKGLSKTTGEESSTEKSFSSSNTSASSSTQETSNTKISEMKHNWNAELGVSVESKASLFGLVEISTSINAKAGAGEEYGSSSETSSSNSQSLSTETSSSTTNTNSSTKTLTNTFDLSNIETQEHKITYEVELPSQEIKVQPNKKVQINAFLNEVNAQVILNLKQTISGTVSANIIGKNISKRRFVISIKEIMQKLQEYYLLPQEITINNDDSITFNGKANISLTTGTDAYIQIKNVD